MARGIQAALAELGAKASAKGGVAPWSLDLATLELSSVFGGALAGEAALEVTSEEALAFRQPAELAALGSLWVPGLESGEALAVAVCEAHDNLRVRLENDLETLARLGIDARLAAPVARARGSLQIGDEDVAVEIDDAGELVVTHLGAARLQAGQGRALGAPEDSDAEEALLRITRVVLRARERGLLEKAPSDPDEDEGIDIDVDVDSLDGESSAATGANVWSEDEHTHAVGESSGVSNTQALSDEQLAAVHEALSEESDETGAPDMSDEAEPIEEPADTGSLPIGGPTRSATTEPPPILDDDDDIRTVSISLHQQSSLLRALDALGQPAAETVAADGDGGTDAPPSGGALVAAPAQVPGTAERGDDEEEEDGEPTISLAGVGPPAVSMAEMPDLPAGSDDSEAQPTVVLPATPAASAESASAMPPPTAAVSPVSVRVPSEEIESVARGFDEGDDIDEQPSTAAPPAKPEESIEDTTGFRFDKPMAAHTLDDAPPATNLTVSQPAEPAVPGPSMEEPSAEEPFAGAEAADGTVAGEEQVEEAAIEPGAPPLATAAPVDTLAMLPPDDDSPPTRNYRLDADGFDDGAGSDAAPVGGAEAPPPYAADAGSLPADVMEPSDTAAIAVPEGLAGAAVPRVSDVEGEPIAPAPIGDDDSDEPTTRPFKPSDLFGLLRRTTDQDDPRADPDVLEARAGALEAEARELRIRAGALRARQIAVTVVPAVGLSSSAPPPPMMEDGRSLSSSSLPSLPSVEVHAIEVPSDDEDEPITAVPPAPPRRGSSAEEGVSLAEVRAALGGVPAEKTRVAGMEVPPERPASIASGESDVFADAFAERPAALSEEPVEPEDARRAILLVVEDARARDRLKRHLSSRYHELFEAADATSAVELPNLTNLAALVFVRPRPDARTRLGLTHLETLERRPRVLIISSDNAFDEMPSVDQRLPLGQRASEVAQQVIDGLTSLGVVPLPT